LNPLTSRRRALRAALFAALAAIAALALPVVAEAKKKSFNTKVMSRNIYLGSDLTGALTASGSVEVFEEGGEIWRNMQETNFNARAKVLADEIVVRKPDLVGLQEAALWRRDERGAPDGPATPAQEVVYDFVMQLRAELRDRGLKYKVAASQQEMDLEIPLDFVDDGTPAGTAYDGRLTMRDVILVKASKRLKVKNAQGANFAAGLPVPQDLGAPGPSPEDTTLNVLRGFTSVDVTKLKGTGKRPAKQRYRFVNTHLEAFSAFFRSLQAGELIAPDSVTDTNKRIVLVGDLNSDPADASVEGAPFSPIPTPNAAAYNRIVGAGFTDVGVTVNTCCHDADLLNPPPAAFSSRIDHVLTKGGKISPVSAALIGTDPAFRTPTGLWPSDHGGVVAKLKLKK
jgi:endonuclease/exonuclease/phosphatase family metal-dependent hydrolase